MELEKSFNNGYGYITILNGKKKLTIEYAPNLDLYFVVEDTSEFLGHFDNKFISYEDYSKMNDRKFEIIKKQDYYTNLVNEGKIVWKCDDYPHDLGPSFKIVKDNDLIKITFDKGNTKKQDLFHPENRTSVRIRTNGSAYNYFYTPFMTLFKELKELVLEDQIHIEEYLYTKKLK